MRRISQWERLGGGNVLGKSLQDLGYDCFAVYCEAYIRHFPGSGPEPDHWCLQLDRPGFAPQLFRTWRRHTAMMLAESLIARQWSTYGIERLIAANPAAFQHDPPSPIPLADCKAFPFWKPRRKIGPEPQPRYMQLLTPEAIVVAKMRSGEGMAKYFGTRDDEEPSEDARGEE